MLGHRKLDLHDYLAILRRRLGVIAVPLVLGPALGFAATFVLVPRYVSSSLIFVDRPTVPSDVVKPMTMGDLLERVSAIQAQILSRSRLEPLLVKYAAPAAAVTVQSDEAIEKLRKSIVIAPVQFTTGLLGNPHDPVPGLTISCTARSPWEAEGLCTDLTSMFIEASLEQMEQLERGTTDFLSVQLAEAKRKLDEEGVKLAAFKRQNLGRLPEEQATNLRVLLDHNTAFEAAVQAVDRAKQDRTYAQSLLQQVSANESGGGPQSPVAASELQARLTKMQATLTELLAQYTPDYPDVVRLRAAIADLKKQIADESAANKAGAPTPAPKAGDLKSGSPQTQQLRAQIQEDDEIIRTRTQEQSRLKTQIAAYEDKLQLSPLVEEEIKNVTRDHEAALRFYNDLLTKKAETELASSLERRAQGERFRLLDPPSQPSKPDFPKRSLFLAGGLAGGLAAGLALALLLESFDKCIRDERDIEVLLKVRNVATLPAVRSLRGWRKEAVKSRKEEDHLATLSLR